MLAESRSYQHCQPMQRESVLQEEAHGQNCSLHRHGRERAAWGAEHSFGRVGASERRRLDGVGIHAGAAASSHAGGAGPGSRAQ
eukprot:2438889-Lingulodinium_polyedra.AAC.1